MGPRKQFYVEQIEPLMTEIIALCKERQIPMFATFELDEGTALEEEERTWKALGNAIQNPSSLARASTALPSMSGLLDKKPPKSN